jgi:2-oxoglutarate ferredoxin oxidoreductase subunit beta
MVYIVENNGVYGLTKGQFSATADKGSKSKKGVVNNDAPIEMVSLRCNSARVLWRVVSPG